MSTYAAGFNAGERQAFADRKTGCRQTRPATFAGLYELGFWDGYTPRSVGWDRSVRPRSAADEQVCQEAEHA